MSNVVRDWKQDNGPECPKCSCGGTMMLDMPMCGGAGVVLYLWKCEKCGRRELKKHGEEKRPEFTFEEEQRLIAGALALREQQQRKENNNDKEYK
jgi:hypothetical protein